MTAFHCAKDYDMVIAFGTDNIEYSRFRETQNSSWDTIFPNYQLRKGKYYGQGKQNGRK